MIWRLFPRIEQQCLLALKVHWDLVFWRFHLAPEDSIDSSLAPKGKHMRSNPQLPLVPPEADPEKIIKKEKLLKKVFLLLLQVLLVSCLIPLLILQLFYQVSFLYTLLKYIKSYILKSFLFNTLPLKLNWKKKTLIYSPPLILRSVSVLIFLNISLR